MKDNLTVEDAQIVRRQRQSVSNVDLINSIYLFQK
jgi:hypothetical protein